MSTKKIQPGRKVEGVVELPGDKSISHRYAILAALAEGTSEIQNYSSAEDCQSTLECLKRLGVAMETRERKAPEPEVSFAAGESAKVLRIGGRGLDGWSAPKRTLNAGNSGTTLRLLTGALAGQRFESKITGDGSLRKRAMRRILEPLRAMGASIEAKEDAYAPLEIRGSALRGIEYATPIASAQVKSCVLLAGLFAEGETTVKEPVATRDHLEVALREFGARVVASKGVVRVHGRPKLEARALNVPGDLSSAVFFLAAALILPGSALMIRNVGLNPTRARVLDFLVGMGAGIQVASVQMREGELVGDLVVQNEGRAGAGLKGGKISGAQTAEMIDELPMLAALGPYTEEGVEIRDARELRMKESDRIAAVAEALREMGARVEELEDGVRVEGRGASGSEARLKGAKIDPRGDHRIAMAMAVAALGAEEETTIKDAQCVGISFPEFFPLMERVVER